MITTTEKTFVFAGALVLAAALIFAGTVVWHDSHQQSTTALQAQVAPRDSSEDAFPHYPAGNVNGAIVSINGNAIQMSVMPPGTTTASTVMVEVLTNKDTQIYNAGPLKDTSAYMAELDTYNKNNKVGLSPDPYEHIVLKISDLKVGEKINVLPQLGSVHDTTMLAQTIMPLDAAPDPLHITAPPTSTPPR